MLQWACSQGSLSTLHRKSLKHTCILSSLLSKNMTFHFPCADLARPYRHCGSGTLTNASLSLFQPAYSHRPMEKAFRLQSPVIGPNAQLFLAPKKKVEKKLLPGRGSQQLSTCQGCQHTPLTDTTRGVWISSPHGWAASNRNVYISFFLAPPLLSVSSVGPGEETSRLASCELTSAPGALLRTMTSSPQSC